MLRIWEIWAMQRQRNLPTSSGHRKAIGGTLFTMILCPADSLCNSLWLSKSLLCTKKRQRWWKELLKQTATRRTMQKSTQNCCTGSVGLICIMVVQVVACHQGRPGLCQGNADTFPMKRLHFKACHWNGYLVVWKIGLSLSFRTLVVTCGAKCAKCWRCWRHRLWIGNGCKKLTATSEQALRWPPCCLRTKISCPKKLSTRPRPSMLKIHTDSRHCDDTAICILLFSDFSFAFYLQLTCMQFTFYSPNSPAVLHSFAEPWVKVLIWKAWQLAKQMKKK